jgi:hypothetical protein
MAMMKPVIMTVRRRGRIKFVQMIIPRWRPAIWVLSVI